MRLARLDRAPERLGVHEAEHQDIARLRVGRDDRNEAVPVEFRRDKCAFL
jgi:hypothetical protein